MARQNNYLVQASQAKERFLTYDQEKLIRKLGLQWDETYLYTTMLGQCYRLSRTTGDLQRWDGNAWVDANSFEEVMTLLDLVCDSREDRYISGRWKNMSSFGLMFHQNLLEGKKDPWADKFEANAEAFRNACIAMGGIPFSNGDVAYAIELFDGLRIVVQLWFGDEEFPASLRLLWDENALQYIRYETMYFAKGLLLNTIEAKMR